MSVDASRDFEDLLTLLGRHEVRYLIVGGLAFVYHAKPRCTKDMGLWIEPTPPNLERANLALAEFGSPALLSQDDTDEVVQIGVAPNPVDLLQRSRASPFMTHGMLASWIATATFRRTGSVSTNCWPSRRGSTRRATRRTHASCEKSSGCGKSRSRSRTTTGEPRSDDAAPSPGRSPSSRSSSNAFAPRTVYSSVVCSESRPSVVPTTGETNASRSCGSPLGTACRSPTRRRRSPSRPRRLRVGSATSSVTRPEGSLASGP